MGCRALGFGQLGLSYVATHKEAFAQAVAKAGCLCAVYEIVPVVGAEPDWNLDLGRIAEWLRKLPKPVGILTSNNSSAREVLLACEVAGLDVPTDVAVMSGTYDELLSEVVRIPLSGIQPNALHVGHLAAEMPDQLMRGKAPPRAPRAGWAAVSADAPLDGYLGRGRRATDEGYEVHPGKCRLSHQSRGSRSCGGTLPARFRETLSTGLRPEPRARYSPRPPGAGQEITHRNRPAQFASFFCDFPSPALANKSP